MNIILYTQKAHPLAEHLPKQLPKHDIKVRSMDYWRGEVEPCDLMLISGYRQRQREIIAAYKVPSLIIDWGYIARVDVPSQRDTGYWQVSPHHLNNPPAFDCPDDRLKITGITLKQKGGNEGGYALICGQMPMDAAVFDHNHEAWLKEQVKLWDKPVYREHPRGGVTLTGVEKNKGNREVAFAGARVIVTHNSNIGFEALAAGVPVVCNPCAAYAELSGEKLPSMAKRASFFSRAAYGQWLWAELGKGIEFTLENLHRWD